MARNHIPFSSPGRTRGLPGAALLAAIAVGVLAALAQLSIASAQDEPANLQTAPAPPPAAPATYVGQEVCESCHTYQAETFEATMMGRIFLHEPRNARERLGCETCHGPGSVHAENPQRDDGSANSIVAFRSGTPRPVAARNAICLSCHENGLRTHWRGSQHETRGLACTDCHRIMERISPRNQFVQPTEIQVCTTCHRDRRAQLYRTSHMPVREGAMQCSSCHNPHGTQNLSLLREQTPNETCYGCHAEKRGPFLYEHAPVRENCLNCHEPHGSMYESLLRVSRPRLCQQCHTESQHPATPQNPNVRFAFNRGCANCHGGMIHGSNDPSGFRLHR